MIYVFFSFLARGTTITAVKTIASSHKTFRVRDSKRNTNVLRRIIAYIICTHTRAHTHIHIPSTIIASSRLNFHRENANDTSEKVPFDDRCLECSNDRRTGFDRSTNKLIPFYDGFDDAFHHLIRSRSSSGGRWRKWSPVEREKYVHEHTSGVWNSDERKFCGVLEGFEIIIFLFLGNLDWEEEAYEARTCAGFVYRL